MLRHLLLLRSEWMESRVMEGANRNGFGEVTTAMNRMFAHMGGRPIGLSELARALDVSRQAVHQLAKEAEILGFVEFFCSETDGRVKLLRFSQKGWMMAENAANEFAAIEGQLEKFIGTDDLKVLKAILSKPWSIDEAS